MAPHAERTGSDVPVDTIAAVSTAPGVGAVAVVRLSGPDAFEVLRRVAPGLGELPPPRTATLTDVLEPVTGERLDLVLVTCFPAPASYTGENVVELSGHGGWLAPNLVVEACVAAGAREAGPGEFTRRAYLNGKIDLIQAEAVVDVVEGRSRALHRAALHQLERGLSARIAGIRAGLVDLEALLVHHIDFPEEDEPPVPVERILGRGRELAAGLQSFLETAPEGELLREGAMAVLAGRPNAGKSSLFNALLGQERAIVTERPGTTRDAVEATVSLGGFPFRLVDTAGLRATDEPVERLGVEVARRYLDRADVVIFCAEAGRSLGADEAGFLAGLEAPVVCVRTMFDRLPSVAPRGPKGRRGTVAGGAGGRGDARPGFGIYSGDGTETEMERVVVAEAGEARPPFPPDLGVSVVTGQGLGRLRERLADLVYGSLVRLGGDAPILTRERHRRAVDRAHREVEAFTRALGEGVPAEVASVHLRPAETALEEVLGIISGDEVLDRVFGAFCIGK